MSDSHPVLPRHRGETESSSGFRPRVLIAEDNELAAKQLQKLLESENAITVDVVTDGRQAADALHKRIYSLFLTDLKMPHVDGMSLIRDVADKQIPVTVVVMTGHGSIDRAVEAMRLGAYDFLTKPLDLDRLQMVMKRALHERALRDEVLYLREQLHVREAFSHVITRSRRILDVLEMVNHVANTNTTVLIEGETGTGKELVARAIHRASAGFRTGPMVAVNCAALPETLLESELFGHEKGAFTGAVGQRKGRFEQAHHGTVFLDEIGEVPLSMQVKLLRVLQERQFERVGGADPIEVDVRVIAASNKSLARMVRKKRFRKDLYYRINVVRIELPPLRERPEDIPILAEHFCRKYARPGEPAKSIDPRVMDELLNHHWPGNVRELENVMERACVTCPSNVIDPEHIVLDLIAPSGNRVAGKVDLRRPLPDVVRDTVAALEQLYIRKALEKTHGHVGKCASLCGLSRRSVTAKLAEYGIDRGEIRERGA